MGQVEPRGRQRFVLAPVLPTVIATSITVLCGMCQLLASSGPVAIIGGLPLVLLLPGLAVIAAVLPWRAWNGELIAWAVGTSLACDIVLGVLLNSLADLRRRTELAALLILTLVGFAVAAARRISQPDEAATRFRPPTQRSLRPVRSPMTVVAAVLTVAAVTAACWISVSSGHAQKEQAFTELWLTPISGAASTGTNSLGVRNDEGRPTDYTVLLTTSTGTHGWRLRLQPSQTWQVPVTIPADGQAKAELYRDGTASPYRVVGLSAGG